MTTESTTGPETDPIAEAEPRVERNDAQGRYEIWLGDVLAGFTEFEPDAQGRLAFVHTEIDPAVKRRGLGSELVAEAMADVARRGESVVPICAFVVRYLRSHDIDGLDVQWPERDSGGR